MVGVRVGERKGSRRDGRHGEASANIRGKGNIDSKKKRKGGRMSWEKV